MGVRSPRGTILSYAADGKGVPIFLAALPHGVPIPLRPHPRMKISTSLTPTQCVEKRYAGATRSTISTWQSIVYISPLPLWPVTRFVQPLYQPLCDHPTPTIASLVSTIDIFGAMCLVNYCT